MKLKFLKIFLLSIVLFGVMSPISVYATEDEEKLDENVFFSQEYIVVLDAGHDSEHVGARGNGLLEEELNMIITKACKEELEKYNNIKVYLTHETLECPFPNDNLAKECNKSRCEYAASVGADLFVSLHVNNNPYRTRGGFEIIYPNDHYKPEYHEEGKVLSKLIVDELKNTGMKFRDIWTRDSDENKRNDENFYPDGSRADYYNVIRNTKYNDILGIIVEHGYLSNYSDVKNFLSSEAVLIEMGQADARGIIKYLMSVDAERKDDNMKKLLKEKAEITKKILKWVKEILE